MNRLIQVKVSGDYLTKDTDQAGTQHEANATKLRITFDESWDHYTKSVTFWDARGANPVTRVLTVDLLENIENTRVYLCPIPAEPMAVAGKFQFVIEGYLAGRRQRAVGDVLRARPAPRVAEEIPSADPTPTQAQQIQGQIDAVLESIRRAIEAANSADAAFAAAQAAQAVANAATAAAAEATQAAQDAKNAVVSKHADRHAASGDDVITPAMIGAVDESDIYRPKYRGIDCVSDLNDFRGYWSGTFTGATTRNVPDATVPFFDVWLSGGSPRFMTQYASVVNETRTYMRKYCDGIWTAWVEVLHSDISPAKIYAAQANRIYDIDAVYPTGLYQVAGPGGTFPAGSEAGIGTLVNNFWDANYVDQIFICYMTFKMYRRRRNGGNWEPWRLVYDEYLVTKSSVDIGEGAAMLPGSFYIVYE